MNLFVNYRPQVDAWTLFQYFALKLMLIFLHLVCLLNHYCYITCFSKCIRLGCIYLQVFLWFVEVFKV